MKNKIKKFSKGDFRTVHPEIVLPVTNLEMTIGEGESCQGSFILKNRKEGDIRGLVYSSSFRIHLEEQGFEGNPVELRFTYDGSGLAPGHVEQGKFTIVCNGGEFEVNLLRSLKNHQSRLPVEEYRISVILKGWRWRTLLRHTVFSDHAIFMT